MYALLPMRHGELGDKAQVGVVPRRPPVSCPMNATLLAGQTRSMMNTVRIELVKKPRKCPTCKSKPVAVVLYGLPAESDELKKKLNAGQVCLGGCVFSADAPAWICVTCGQQIYRRISL